MTRPLSCPPPFRTYQGAPVDYCVHPSRWGDILVCSTPQGIAGLHFLHTGGIASYVALMQQRGYAMAADPMPSAPYSWHAQLMEGAKVPLIVAGTPWQKRVWQATMEQVATGQTMSYQGLTNRLGLPKGARAVAGALGSNTIAYLIPCHRIIGKDGQPKGYRWGIAMKQRLLEAEQEEQEGGVLLWG